MRKLISSTLVSTAALAGALAFAGTASASVTGGNPLGDTGGRCTAVTFSNISASTTTVTEGSGGPKLYNGEEVSYAGPSVTDYWVTDVSGNTFELSSTPSTITLHTEGDIGGPAWDLTVVCPSTSGNQGGGPGGNCPQGGKGNYNNLGDKNACQCQGQYTPGRDSYGNSCQQCGGKFDPLTADVTCTPVTSCSTAVTTPQESNYSWVENTTGETVTVTLDGKYFWVQTRTGNGPVTYLGPTTTTVTLAPGESISVAWRNGSGEHSWCWTGCCTTVTANPCPVVTPPGDPRTTGWTQPKQPCRTHQDPPCGNQHGHNHRYTVS
jgi:hypothetical protein